MTKDEEIESLRKTLEHWQRIANQGIHIERDLRTNILKLENAIDAFSKATSLKDGPSLALQRHDPTWVAWTKLCHVLADIKHEDTVMKEN